jgi:MtfA peptidase
MPDSLQQYTHNSPAYTYERVDKKGVVHYYSGDNIEVLLKAAELDSISEKRQTTQDEIDQKVYERQKAFYDSITPYVFLSLIFVVVLLHRFGNRWLTYLKTKWYGFLSKNELPNIITLLKKEYPFYNTLNNADQEKFAKRVFQFKSSKFFDFDHDWDDEDKIKYLVSASAVQLTLGLDDFMLSYFSTIVIHHKGYHFGLYRAEFQGHVQDREIHLSWEYFKRGIDNPTDRENVGLHEMAHALAYECFNVGGQGDSHFRNEFANFSTVGRPIFNNMQLGNYTILGSYAATNYHEFWAVCVEVFFEQPQQLYNELPELYIAIKKLLRQDLLSR